MLNCNVDRLDFTFSYQGTKWHFRKKRGCGPCGKGEPNFGNPWATKSWPKPHIGTNGLITPHYTTTFHFIDLANWIYYTLFLKEKNFKIIFFLKTKRSPFPVPQHPNSFSIFPFTIIIIIFCYTINYYNYFLVQTIIIIILVKAPSDTFDRNSFGFGCTPPLAYPVSLFCFDCFSFPFQDVAPLHPINHRRVYLADVSVSFSLCDLIINYGFGWVRFRVGSGLDITAGPLPISVGLLSWSTEQGRNRTCYYCH